MLHLNFSLSQLSFFNYYTCLPRNQETIFSFIGKARTSTAPEKRQKTSADEERQLTEIEKQYSNISTVLKFSNATPFRDRNALGYVCAYCKSTFPDPTDLRQHTREEHSKHLLAYIAGKKLEKLVVTLDIMNLQCTICNESVEDIKQLGEHLVRAHDKKFYTDIGDYIQPFRLTIDKLMKCCLCTESFSCMKTLLLHMNAHFRNFICTICGAGFINFERLKSHETMHHKAKKWFVCSHCKEKFDAEWKKKKHVNAVHRGVAGPNKCQVCKATFASCYQKNKHMIECHNQSRLKCEMCDKTFVIKSTLLLHFRRTHLKERPFQCDICYMGFFCKTRLTEHLVVHTGEKQFSCEMCGQAFARKKNLRLHLKTHK